MVKNMNMLEPRVALHSKSREFKEQVIKFDKKRIGKAITFESFEKCLNRSGYCLLATGKYWRAVFSSILNYHFYYETSYKLDRNQQLITVFELKYVL